VCNNAFGGIKVISKMDKYTIITLKKKGISFRQIAKELEIDRKTVSKIWKTYQKAQLDLFERVEVVEKPDDSLVETIVGDIKYDIQNRGKRKMTEEVKKRILELLELEEAKDKLLGLSHKQKLTGVQIYETLKEENVDIGQTTVRNFLREIRQSRETYIRQEYDYGQRLEYDFGEIKLMINNKKMKFYLAVMAAPASAHRHAYLYQKQNQAVFLDSHVRFFELMKGSWKEVVYDNMKNVVNRFLTQHDKVINQEALNLAMYYGFEINTTNVQKGNEKGTVENAVKVIRNRVFAKRYQFETYEQACQYLEEQLEKINRNSLIEEEKKHLTPYRFPYEIASIEAHSVDKYGCIRVDNNYYSVPDILLDKQVSVKKYHDRIVIYSNHELVVEHKKIDGSQQYQLVLSHYLNTLATKPGALKHSLLLKQQPELYDIYHLHFKTRAKEFIDILQANKHASLEELINILRYRSQDYAQVLSQRDDEIQNQSRKQLQSINQLMN
jgi:transposase